LGKNRDRLSIVAAILEAANSGASKTKIMFGANLSFCLLEKYLDIALKARFIQIKDYKYSLTENGREFLKEYKHFEERCERAKELLDSLSSERAKLTLTCERAQMFNGAGPIMDITSKFTVTDRNIS
jgi:predicted transcriptional regulator